MNATINTFDSKLKDVHMVRAPYKWMIAADQQGCEQAV
jgi:hypothetical protein